MEEKKVCINIKSVQNSDEGEDITELFTYGLLSGIEGGYRVTYEETETMGFDGCTVTLDILKDQVSMTRSGNASSSLIIERGRKHHCHYGTPYGNFMVGINTNTLENGITDSGGDLSFAYTIDINSGFLSENEMYINVRECEN